MNAHTSEFGARRNQAFDYTPLANLIKGLRGWWLTPPRPGIHRVIAPWLYRHLRFFGILHIVGGAAAAIAGLICLSYSVNGWAAFFLVVAALNLAGGCWFLSIDRSASARI
jgi:hypothetical protein